MFWYFDKIILIPVCTVIRLCLFSGRIFFLLGRIRIHRPISSVVDPDSFLFWFDLNVCICTIYSNQGLHSWVFLFLTLFFSIISYRYVLTFKFYYFCFVNIHNKLFLFNRTRRFLCWPPTWSGRISALLHRYAEDLLSYWLLYFFPALLLAGVIHNSHAYWSALFSCALICQFCYL